jgi:hypothetical protein
MLGFVALNPTYGNCQYAPNSLSLSKGRGVAILYEEGRWVGLVVFQPNKIIR